MSDKVKPNFVDGEPICSYHCPNSYEASGPCRRCLIDNGYADAGSICWKWYKVECEKLHAMIQNDHDWPDPNSWKYHLRVAAYRWFTRLIHRYPAKLDEDQDDKNQDDEDQDDNPPATGKE